MKYFSIEKFWNFSLISVAITLPFDIKANSISIIIFIFISLVSIIKNKRKDFSLSLPIVFLLIFFFLKVVSFFYSDDSKEAIFHIEKSLSLLFLPVFTYWNKEYIKVKPILLSFSFAVLANLLINLTRLYFHDPLERMFFVEEHGFNFRRAFDMYYGVHPTYFSLYLLVSSVINIYYIKLSKYLTPVLIISTLICIAFIGIFSSRIIVFSSIIVGIVSLIQFFNKKHKSLYIVGLMFTSILLLIVYKNTPSLKVRFSEAINTKAIAPTNFKEMNSTNIRFAQWKCIKETITEINLITGEGVGDAQKIINSCYKIHNWAPDLYEKNYNYHNQYIQTLYQIGVIGLIFNVSVLVLGIYFGIKNNNKLLLYLSTIYTITSLTESVFEVQKGIVFFALFYSILTLIKHEKI